MDEMFFTEKRKLEMLQKSKDFAKYKSERISCEQYRKHLKGKLMKQAEEQGVKSLQAQEREAYASPDYEECVNALEFAIRMESELYWELKLFDIEVQVWRTNQANKRNDV